MLGRTQLSKQDKSFDIPLMIVVVALVCVGLLFVYSASSYTAQKHYGNQYHFVFKQLIGAIVGGVSMVALMFVNVNVLKKFWLIAVVVTVVLLV